MIKNMIPIKRLQRNPGIWLTFSLFSFLLIGIALFMQHYMGYEPCFLCIIQRIAIILICITTFIAGVLPRIRVIGYLGWITGTVVGIAAAARQIFLQHNPLEVYSCGPGADFILENNSIVDAIPLLLKPQSDCSQIDITFLTLPLSYWMLMGFLVSLYFIMLFLHREFKKQ